MIETSHTLIQNEKICGNEFKIGADINNCACLTTKKKKKTTVKSDYMKRSANVGSRSEKKYNVYTPFEIMLKTNRIEIFTIVKLCHPNQFRFWIAVHSVSQRTNLFAVCFLLLTPQSSKPEWFFFQFWFSYLFCSDELVCIFIHLFLVSFTIIVEYEKTQHTFYFVCQLNNHLRFMIYFFSSFEIACTYAPNPHVNDNKKRKRNNKYMKRSKLRPGEIYAPNTKI